jgi:protein-S-isoprenylcysteine O-methyltransferase Ste14
VHQHFTYRELIFALWITWFGYWLISAAATKPTRQRESRASRLTYTVPLLLGVWLIARPRVGSGWFSAQLLPEARWRYLLALALLLAGLLLTVWARVHLGRNWSGTVTLKEGHELIRSGPYAYVRHPIYTGLSLAMLGCAIAWGEPRALLGLGLVICSFLYKLRPRRAVHAPAVPGTVPALQRRSAGARPVRAAAAGAVLKELTGQAAR